MLNRINNISFKGTFIHPSVVMGLGEKNYEKIVDAGMMLDLVCPDNDIFIYNNQKNEVCYRVQKKNNLMKLFEPDVLKKIKTNPYDLANMVSLSICLQKIHEALWNIKTPLQIDKVENIDEMDGFDVFMQINTSAEDFNRRYPDVEN